MSRWHPPRPSSAPYITPEGAARLERELRGLWDRRAGVTAALTAAAAEGDRSENAEYIYRKKELREIDRRIGYLQRRIPALQVVRDIHTRDRVHFGAWVSLETGGGDQQEVRIVGADEIDHDPAYISVDSPLARVLLGKNVDAEVTLRLESRSVGYCVTAIRYTLAGLDAAGES